MVSMTTGGPPPMFSGWGLNPSLDSILTPIQHGIFWFTGFEPLAPFIAWGVSRCSDQQRLAYLDAYQQRLAGFFTEEPIRYPRLSECDASYIDAMPRFMAAWTWNGPDSPEIDALAAQERAVLESWRRDGVLLQRWIAENQESGWLILRERSEDALRARLARLPLHPWLTFSVTTLANA